MAFWLADGRVLAGMHVNQWDSLGPVEELIKARDRVNPDRLADVDLPIDQALASPTGARDDSAD